MFGHMAGVEARRFRAILPSCLKHCPNCFVDSGSDMSGHSDTAILIKVDPSGHGDFRKIQDAIDSVPANNKHLYFISVKPGTYRERVVVPMNKPYITLSGSKSKTTAITLKLGGDIFESAVLSVLASDFVGRYLTIQNTFGSSGVAVALRVRGDKCAFYGCRMISYQDTILDDHGRHYYKNCYIEGATDFICGSSASLYEKCHLHTMTAIGGPITAQKRDSSSENTGFTFLGCRVTGSHPGRAFLGRPWANYSRVVFAQTYLSSVIEGKGWTDWRGASKHGHVYYGEYKCHGPGANRSKRVWWSRGLSDKEAAPFLTKEMIGGRGWLRPIPRHFKRGSKVVSVDDIDGIDQTDKEITIIEVDGIDQTDEETTLLYDL